MTVPEAILRGLMLFVVVFIVLGMIFLLILVFSRLVKLIEQTALKKQPATASAAAPAAVAVAAPAPQPEQANGPWGGSLRLKNVDEQTAAMVMAIVSDESGIPLSQLIFKQIALVEPGSKQEEEA